MAAVHSGPDHRFTPTLLGLLLCIGSAAHATAPPDEPAPTSRGEQKALRDFRLLDANGDGRLSRDEVRWFPRLAAAFDAADTNHDGYVSQEEVRAFAVKYRAERERQRATREEAKAAR